MKKYELMYIVPSKYTEAEMDELIKKVAGILETAGAQISETHNMGKRRLAYPIEHHRNGTYTLVHFEAETKSIAKIDEVLRLTSEILRHLIVERDPHLKQLPVFTDTEERRTEEARERQPAAPMIQAKPVSPSAKPESVNIEELDKKLDEILTEEIL
ncbi:30S ribosomal protein S6 [Patescibacteria group bacterium]|nr:30S ribosomal protein S6 [Patescibacteria group bacterium]MBU1029036.1 30S ribosomal protein S6 [Patescibacteria group bacterium]MBU1915653.1 30S ribosomal protein S6 [Patescibacteria group bacterium]